MILTNGSVTFPPLFWDYSMVFSLLFSQHHGKLLSDLVHVLGMLREDPECTRPNADKKTYAIIS